jgi:archaellum component FlaC
MKIFKNILSLFKDNKNNVSKTMSTYERTINRLKNRIHTYQNKCTVQKEQLLKTNTFINKLRDEGRVTKDEIEIYFKK